MSHSLNRDLYPAGHPLRTDVGTAAPQPLHEASEKANATIERATRLTMHRENLTWPEAQKKVPDLAAAQAICDKFDAEGKVAAAGQAAVPVSQLSRDWKKEIDALTARVEALEAANAGPDEAEAPKGKKGAWGK